MQYTLPLLAGFIALVSIILSPKANNYDVFFKGHSKNGPKPDLITLIFSQVTTWIFARSLLNAAILGYYYGIWGTIAYSTYYLSFLTGGRIVDAIRFQQGFDSVQAFLHARFGGWGTGCYNFVIGVRLISEVFANLLVIGILFGTAGSNAYTFSVIGFALVTLFYSSLGGLSASLRTDVFQLIIFVMVLILLVLMCITNTALNFSDLLFKPFQIKDPGPVLILVALLQIWSYPMHDPVMMDRGFLANRETTARSFRHAAWISIICIMVFGCFGVFAGANAMPDENMTAALSRLLGENTMLVFNAALVISAMSTLDSTLSSSSKLLVVDMSLIKPTLFHGRITMTIFMLLGIILVFWGNKDLFSAVAVSGTASMYLTPVVFFSLWGNRRDIPVWSYVGTFLLAIGSAALYFTESSGYTQFLGDYHKYTKLLFIAVLLMSTGCALFWLGQRTDRASGHIVKHST